MNRAKVIFCAVAMLATATCMVLPVIGANGFSEHFRVPYSRDLHFKMLAGQLVGPGFSMAFYSFLLWTFLSAKRFPWWVATIGLIGPIYTAWAAREYSHDFSHVVFSECGNIYDEVIGWLCTLGGLALLAICALLYAEERRYSREDLIRKIPAVLCILAYSMLAIAVVQGRVHGVSLAVAPALVLIGMGARRWFWPGAAKAAAMVVVILFVCFVTLLGFSAAMDTDWSFRELISESLELMVSYSLWLWLPFVIGIALGGVRSGASKPGLPPQTDIGQPPAFPDPR